MVKVGIRELKNNLSRYLEQVKEGTPVYVTDRGLTVARISKEPKEPSDELQERLEELERRGELIAPRGARPRDDWKPIRGKGKSTSDIVIESRR